MEKSSVDLFGFLASNTNVEYGFIATDEKSYTIFTDNKHDRIDMMTRAHGIEKEGKTINIMVHSHPENSKPSGFGDSDGGDRIVAMLFDDPFAPPIEHFVYIPKYNSVIQYDKDHVMDDILVPLEFAFKFL